MYYNIAGLQATLFYMNIKEQIYYDIKKTQIINLLLNCMHACTGEPSFPTHLGCWLCARRKIEELTKSCMELGVQYLGLCCGNRSCYTRVIAETVGHHPPARKYSPDMTKHLSRIASGKHDYDWERWHLNFGFNNFINRTCVIC